MCYALFIITGTGPQASDHYPRAENSPYKLPWAGGVKHFVSQGNRSFTSHRGLHLYSWDFWMSIGSKVLAAREGKVIEVVDHFDGIGLHSNFIKIEHNDGTVALYAHIKLDGSVVKVGDQVRQGQLIAHSGMVGQTINPHLHFVVLNHQQAKSLPNAFSEVNGAVPLAGHSYISQNSNLDSP